MAAMDTFKKVDVYSIKTVLFCYCKLFFVGYLFFLFLKYCSVLQSLLLDETTFYVCFVINLFGVPR